jgi:hypothetical protein
MFYNKYSLVILLLYHITKIRTQLISLFGLSLLLGIKKLLLPWLWFKKMKNKLMKPERWDPNNLLAAFTDGVGNPLSKIVVI